MLCITPPVSTPYIPRDRSPDVICFSHLRWDFVYQRPQHLMSRAQRKSPLHYWEEPIFENVPQPKLTQRVEGDGVRVLTPVLPVGTSAREITFAQRSLLDEYIYLAGLENFIAWYYTPMSLLFSDHLNPVVTVYDCMDELSAFQGAPPELVEQEQRLFEQADVVFAGGASLYASKRTQHENVHLFPSSIDRKHFAAAMRAQPDPEDQKDIPHPRVGFYGVLDERLDQQLLRELAAMKPDWHFILVGPVVKISAQHLPQASNIHYLGMKSYESLPRYLSGWDMAMQPFARNASTRFISPTKTPEFLAAGRPIVSTAIHDVVRPYGDLGLVEIANDAAGFSEAIERGLASDAGSRQARADEFLADKSWDKTFAGMWTEITKCVYRDTATPTLMEMKLSDSRV